MVGGAADWKMLENECLIKETRLLPLTHITFPSLSLLSLSHPSFPLCHYGSAKSYAS